LLQNEKHRGAFLYLKNLKAKETKATAVKQQERIGASRLKGFRQGQKRNGGWTADTTGSGEKSHQIKCLIASEGWQWMRSYFDRLPVAVRQRLTVSRFNICPACMDEEAHRRAAVPSVKIYIETIEAIEREMDRAE
jgi:hypothetical protein